MHKLPLTRYRRAALAGIFLIFAGVGWASTGACLNPSGVAVSGCSTVDLSFTNFITPANNDFASTGVGTNYLYNPTLADQGGSGWTFSSSGVPGGGADQNGALIYGSQWYAGTAPGGPQVGGLQQFSGSTVEASISQTISGFTAGDSYGVTFYMADRENSAAPAPGDTIEVTLGGQILGTFTPSSGTWTPVTTGTMVATTGTMTLDFISVSTGQLSTSEVDALIDDVVIGDIQCAPESATLGLVGGGLILLGAFRRMPVPRRKKAGILKTAQSLAAQS